MFALVVVLILVLLALTGVRTCLIVVSAQGQSMLPTLPWQRETVCWHCAPLCVAGIRKGRSVLVNPSGEN
jgi:hypothetical protein